MRSRTFVRGVIAALALGSLALAGEEPRAPLRPWADASRGDWACYVGTRTVAGRAERVVLVREVRALDGETVTLATTAPLETRTREQVFPRGQAPELAPLLGLEKGEGPLTLLETKREARRVRSRELACRRVEARVGERRARAWLCPEVRASGLVALEVEGERSLEVAGFGTTEGPEWGKDPLVLAAEFEPDVPEGENPWARVGVGTEVELAIVISATVGSGPERENVRTTLVEKDAEGLTLVWHSLGTDGNVREGRETVRRDFDPRRLNQLVGRETVETPAGVFECERFRWFATFYSGGDQAARADLWIARGVPVPVREIQHTRGGTTIEITLTRLRLVR